MVLVLAALLLGVCCSLVALSFAEESVAGSSGTAADVTDDCSFCSSTAVKVQLQKFAAEVGSVATFSNTPLNWLPHAQVLVKTLADCKFQPLALANLTVELPVSSNAAREYDLATWGSRRGWPRFLESTDSMDEPGSDALGTRISVPAVDFVLRSYLASRQFEVRQMLLALLNAGVDPDLVTPWTADEPPPFLQALDGIPFDTELFDTFLNAGASVAPFAVAYNRGKTSTAEGVSLLHVLHQSLEHVHLIKKVFIVADAGKKMMLMANSSSNVPPLPADGTTGVESEVEGFCSRCMSSANDDIASQASYDDARIRHTVKLSDVFRLLASQPQMNTVKDWQGDFFEVVYKSLWHVSALFRELDSSWVERIGQDAIRRDVSHTLHEDLKIFQAQRMLSRSESPLDVREISLRQFGGTSYGRARHVGSDVNFVTLCVLANMPRLLDVVTTELFRRSSSLRAAAQDPQHTRAVSATASEIDCSSSKDGFVWHLDQALDGGKLLALAQTLHGAKSPMAELLFELQSEVRARCPLSRQAHPESPLDIGATNIYCSLDSTGENSGNVTDWLAEVASGGGWHQQKLAQSRSNVSNAACDIIEISSLPSHEQFAQLLRTARPFIIRGGAAVGMGLAVKHLEKAALLSNFGDRPIEVDNVPYSSSFRSDGLWSDGGAREDAPVQQRQTTLAAFVAKLDARQTQATDNEAVDPGAHEGGEKMLEKGGEYLFSTSFMAENPGVASISDPVKQWLMNVNGVEHVRGGQFFLGGSNTGAPMHFHRLAVNLVAFGEKQWFLYPPHHPQATYTALTTTEQWLEDHGWLDLAAAGKNFVVEGVGDSPSSSNSLNCTASRLETTINFHVPLNNSGAAPVPPLRVVQRAGDVVVVPEEWAHATFNSAPSIGVAHEVVFSPHITRSPCSLGAEASATDWTSACASPYKLWHKAAGASSKRWTNTYIARQGFNISRFQEMFPNFPVHSSKSSSKMTSKPRRPREPTILKPSRGNSNANHAAYSSFQTKATKRRYS